MHAGADEAAAHPGARLRGFPAVVDDEVKVLAEVVVAGPAVELFPLVGAHEPVQPGFRMGGEVVLHEAPAPAGGRQLQIQLRDICPGEFCCGQVQHVQALLICKEAAGVLLER